MPPPDAIKSALLLGLIIGQGQFMGTIDEMPCCDVCREQLEHLKASVYQGMESAEAAAGEGDEVSGEEVSGEPQPETEDEPAVMNDEPG